MWTIETFTMFYPKTFAQRNVIPILGLIPLFISISTFVYDYYSDIELTLEYYESSSLGLEPIATFSGPCFSSLGGTVSETNLNCNLTTSFVQEKQLYFERLVLRSGKKKPYVHLPMYLY